MKELITDRLKLSMVLAGLFSMGLIWLLFSIYSLPASLGLTDNFSAAWMNVYLLTIAVFGVGIAAYFLLLNSKKEIVVYVEKKAENKLATEAETQQKNAISLAPIMEAVGKSTKKKEITQTGLLEICNKVEAGQAALYVKHEEDGKRILKMESTYALSMVENHEVAFNFGEGLVGQSAAMKKTMYIDDIPEGYIKIVSGLGSSSPRFLSIIPLINGDDVLGVMEVASFKNFSKEEREFIEKAGQVIADKLSKI